jgi:thiamine biosynthesis lipoprotein
MLAIKTLIPKAIIFRRSVRLMGNQVEISIVGNDTLWAEERIDDAIAEINRVEKLLSSFSDDSIINQVNRNAGERPVKVASEIFRLVDRALQISELTHGAFDITYNTADKVPGNFNMSFNKKSVKTALIPVNYQSVILDTKTQTVFLKEKSMRIGFGAVINGYAVDRAKYILQMKGVQSGVINAGGDLITWGAQPDDQPWTVATADPCQTNQPYANVDISNMAIATSVGSGKCTATINKKNISNVNRESGFPVSEIKSVSIISPSAELADAMATPVTSIGINAGLYLINQLNQVACVIVDDHDRIYASKDVCTRD